MTNKFKHVNCRCAIPEMEITCTTPNSDYDTVETPKKKIRIIDYDNPEDVEYLKEYNKKMKDVCPNFEPYPTNKEDYKKLMHEKAIQTCGGIENLNFAKAIVGEKTGVEAVKKIAEYASKRMSYGTYPTKTMIEDRLKRGYLNCTDRSPTEDEIKFAKLIETLKKEGKDQ